MRIPILIYILFLPISLNLLASFLDVTSRIISVLVWSEFSSYFEPLGSIVLFIYLLCDPSQRLFVLRLSLSYMKGRKLSRIINVQSSGFRYSLHQLTWRGCFPSRTPFNACHIIGMSPLFIMWPHISPSDSDFRILPYYGNRNI